MKLADPYTEKLWIYRRCKLFYNVFRGREQKKCCGRFMPDKMMTFLIQNSAVCKGSRYCREIEKKKLGLNIRILVQRNNFNRNITRMKKRFALIKIQRKK